MTEEQKKEHIDKIKKILDEEKIFTFKDIFVFYKGCSRSYAYENNLDKVDDIKDSLEMNKRRGVQSLVDKWIDSENATLQIAAFKIIADADERRAISQNYTDITTKDESINIDPFAQMRKNAEIDEETTGCV